MKGEIEKNRTWPVAVWLLVGVFMIIIQIILGGITRLTDSGLSITEWAPLLGTVPPMNETEWNRAFENYKEIAQFKHLHSHFTLDDFKSIFFWEWLHRFWGRLIGVVFIIPFFIFLFQRRFSANMIRPLLILFLLGALQALVGWIMVLSGLNSEDIYVSHIRLAVHFIVAVILLVYNFWFALALLVPAEQKIQQAGSRRMILIIFALLTVQLIYGAFMAGLKAAMMAPTWPDINGGYFPATGSFQGREFSFISSLINHPLVIHFIHRNLAYVIVMLVLAWTYSASRIRGGHLFNKIKWIPLLLILLQVGLGIGSVLTAPGKVPQQWGVFEWYAQLHQFTAMLILLSLTLVLFLHRSNKMLNRP